MAILSLEDPTGSTEVVVFPNTFESYAYLLKGDEPLLVSGSAEVEGGSAKIIAQEIVSMETVRQRAVKAVELHLQAQNMSRTLLENIRDVLFRYPGDCTVLFRVDMGEDKEVIIQAHKHYRITPCDEVRREIEALTREKVICKYGR